jgi:hypothetical protein
MTRLELHKALESIRPNCQWEEQELQDGSFSFIWTDSSPAPTIEEVSDAHATLQATNYKELRKVAYPPIGDQLDALWKGGQAWDDMKVIIDSVKAQYPKPE